MKSKANKPSLAANNSKHFHPEVKEHLNHNACKTTHQKKNLKKKKRILQPRSLSQPHATPRFKISNVLAACQS